MSIGRITRCLITRTPGLPGVILLVVIALAVAGCGKKSSTPEWGGPSASLSIAAPEASNSVTTAASSAAGLPGGGGLTPAAGGSPGGLRFIAYNVQNWLTMERYVNKKLVNSQPKPAAEKAAVIKLLVHNTPDVVGICEIGEAHDLAEIQQALKAAGLDLPYSQYTGGADPVRHLGLLSRFPLTAPATPAVIEYQMNGQSLAINRGILDAAIATNGKSYRLLGVHLKSKREIEQADQDEMRIHEARLVRSHVDGILKADANARLIVYGDFNDTRPTKAFKAVTGSYNAPGYLTAIPFKDTRGEAWTHYWSLHDIYSRFDFVLVSRALKPEVDFRASHIIDDPIWSDASDHRPLLTIFK